MGFGEDRPPPYLMGVNLSEDQQDKVFAILHAAAPQLREHMKAARKARDALRDLSESSDYDNGKATTLAQAQASAESQLTLLRTRTDHDIYLVLTQEQRTQVAQRQRERHAHEGAPPPP
jgi:Spy/CpxP family protein refolding chaperone